MGNKPSSRQRGQSSGGLKSRGGTAEEYLITVPRAEEGTQGALSTGKGAREVGLHSKRR